MKSVFNKLDRILFTIGAVWLLIGASYDFFNIAWGTGDWYGEFSQTWFVLYIFFVILSTFFLGFANACIWGIKLIEPITRSVVRLRNYLGSIRWLLWFFILLIPIYFFQYSPWGVVFQKLYIRAIIWLAVVFFLTILSSADEILVGWNELLSSLVVTASAFSIFASLVNVNNYPFSLGWSEGNRLWDYSMLFGRDLYVYSQNETPFVLLDFGRQLIGGLPFIFSGVTIFGVRLWIGLMLIIPYILLGAATFRRFANNKTYWVIASLFVFLFLKQGPIHPPLVLSAALVALAWGAPLWFGIPLVIGAGYFAVVSRFSWVFAPGIWIVMLEFASASFSRRDSASIAWKRSFFLGISGILGGVLFPKIVVITSKYLSHILGLGLRESSSAEVATQFLSSGINSNIVVQGVTSQPLLWYRLLPNSTYGLGILFALLLAVIPLLIVLFYIISKSIWKLSSLQKLSILLPLLAFLGVGLIASTKIGGGGDLHNMDMFLVGVLFTGAIAWHSIGKDWLINLGFGSITIKILIVFMIVYTSISPLMEMRSFSFGEDVSWIKTLADSSDEQELEMLPTKDSVNQMLLVIQREVDKAKLKGDVLFIDQRQLLTFGYIKNVSLVPEYEKKVLMTVALSEDTVHLEKFYSDLKEHRFSLIISEPMRTPIQDTTFQFGEENNAWTSWVAIPVLCYYEPLITENEFRVQLLVPKSTTEECSLIMPR